MLGITSVAHGAPDGGACSDDAGVSDECLAAASAGALLVQARALVMEQRYIDALQYAKRGLEAAIRDRDTGRITEARELVTRLIEEIPHVTFVPPTDTTDLHVTFDARPVATESLTKKFSVDPGRHIVHAEGLTRGMPTVFEEKLEIGPRDVVSVRLVMKPPPEKCLTCASPLAECLRGSKSEAELRTCIAKNDASQQRSGCRACVVAPVESGASGLLALFPLIVFCMRRVTRHAAGRTTS
jgi:hypothetical protein